MVPEGSPADGAQMERPMRARAATGEDGRSRDRTRPPLPDPLPIPVVDAHCHLDIADGKDGAWLSAPDAIRKASAAGVTRIVQVGCDLPGAAWAVDAAATYDGVIAAVALHPTRRRNWPPRASWTRRWLRSSGSRPRTTRSG